MTAGAIQNFMTNSNAQPETAASSQNARMIIGFQRGTYTYGARIANLSCAHTALVPESATTADLIECTQCADLASNAGPWGIRNNNGFVLFANTWEPKRFENQEAAQAFLDIALSQEQSEKSQAAWNECKPAFIPHRISATLALQIVNCFRELLFRDYDPADTEGTGERDFLNPDKEWSIETAQTAAEILREAGLIESEVSPFVDVELA